MRTAQKVSAHGSVVTGSASAEKRNSAKKRASGCGLAGSRRKKSDRLALCGVTKNDIRRLARKAGEKLISDYQDFLHVHSDVGPCILQN